MRSTPILFLISSSKAPSRSAAITLLLGKLNQNNIFPDTSNVAPRNPKILLATTSKEPASSTNDKSGDLRTITFCFKFKIRCTAKLGTVTRIYNF